MRRVDAIREDLIKRTARKAGSTDKIAGTKTENPYNAQTQMRAYMIWHEAYKYGFDS
jgi:hypothetical protein